MRGEPGDHNGPTVFATHSTHKLLNALSQASYIHVREGRGLVNLFRHLLENGLLCIRIFNLLNTVQTPRKTQSVARHQRIQPLLQGRKGQFLLFCHNVSGQ